MEITIDQVAIWTPKLGSDKFTRRVDAPGRRYVEAGKTLVKVSETSMYRFAKNYERYGYKFCLFVRTLTDITDAVAEKRLDKIASSLSKDRVAENLGAITANAAIGRTDFFVTLDVDWGAK